MIIKAKTIKIVYINILKIGFSCVNFSTKFISDFNGLFIFSFPENFSRDHKVESRNLKYLQGF
jgi:hypothetical protein